MSSQFNPKNYQMMCRCPLEDAAVIKARADKNGQTLNAYMSALIHKHVAGAAIDAEMREWIADKLASNLRIRAKADEETAAGRYRAKHPKKPGRPRKHRLRVVVKNDA